MLSNYYVNLRFCAYKKMFYISNLHLLGKPTDHKSALNGFMYCVTCIMISNKYRKCAIVRS